MADRWEDERRVVAAMPEPAEKAEAEKDEPEKESDGEDAEAVVRDLQLRAEQQDKAKAPEAEAEAEGNGKGRKPLVKPEEDEDDDDSALQAEGSRNALEQLGALTKATAAPTSSLPTALDNAELAMEPIMQGLPAVEQELRSRTEPRRRKQDEPSIGETLIATTDNIYGPGPEATPSAIGGAMAAAGPVWSETGEGGLGVTGESSGIAGFGVGFAGAMDFIGNVARIVTGVMRFVKGVRTKPGIHKLTSKDSRIGLGFITQGALGAGAVLVGLIKAIAGSLSKVGEFIAGPLAGGVGVVLGLINTVLSIRRAVRAGKRAETAESVEKEAEFDVLWNRVNADFHGQSTVGRKFRQDQRFWNRLRAAAAMLKTKASRKKTRKWGAALGSAIGAAGGATLLLVTVGVLTAANIWNPIGWTLAGIGLGVAIGYGVYKLYRRIRQSKTRKEDLQKAAAPSFWTGSGKSSRVVPEAAGDYAKFIKTEIDCEHTRGHLNHTEHERVISDFVTRVLGKKPSKVKERDESYIAGKWGSW